MTQLYGLACLVAGMLYAIVAIPYGSPGELAVLAVGLSAACVILGKWVDGE